MAAGSLPDTGQVSSLLAAADSGLHQEHPGLRPRGMDAHVLCAGVRGGLPTLLHPRRPGSALWRRAGLLSWRLHFRQVRGRGRRGGMSSVIAVRNHVVTEILCNNIVQTICCCFFLSRLFFRWRNSKAYVIAVSQVLAAPCIVGVLLAPTPHMSYGLLFLAYVTAETWLGPAAAIVQVCVNIHHCTKL